MRSLNCFQKWCVDNGMKLNVKKSKALVIGTSYKLNSLDIDNRFVLNGVVLGRGESYNYLGVYSLDTHMNLSPLLKKVKRIVCNKIILLLRLEIL